MVLVTKNSRGITFIEIATVMAVILILASFAVPSIGPMYERVRLRNAAHIITRQLSVAKMRAVSDPHTHCGVYFDVASSPQKTLVFYDVAAGTSYQYDEGTDETTLGVNILPERITLELPPSGAITNNVIVFRGDGSAKNGGSILVKNRHNDVRKVNVLPSTGRIKVSIE